MINSRRKNRLIAYIYYSIILIFTLLNISSGKAETMKDVKYLVSFKTKRSACMLRVNGFPIFENFTYSSGTISAGDNITSFIENGKNNIEVLMGLIDPNDKNTLYPDSECEVIITRDTVDSSEMVTTFRLNVDADKNIIATSSSNYEGYKHEGQITEEQLPEDSTLLLHRFSRDIEFSGIKAWAWVNADRVVSDKDLPAIQDKYREIWKAIKNRDIKQLKDMATISSQEMGIAEGLSPDIVFESYNLPKNVADADLTPLDLEWDKYKLTTYCGGRVFRLTVGYYQNSPLRLKNKEGQIVYSYDPYLSIIDGKVVIVR